MRFTTIIASLFAASAMAAPNAVTVRETTAVSTQQMTSAIAFAAAADDCSILKCAGVVAAAGCIAAGIATGQVEAVTACVSGGAGLICDCAACVDALNNFLQSNGVCT